MYIDSKVYLPHPMPQGYNRSQMWVVGPTTIGVDVLAYADWLTVLDFPISVTWGMVGAQSDDFWSTY